MNAEKPQPLVSLYIPTRGRPALVVRALRSALAQTHSELEILVVIDGPDADTLKALQPYRENQRVRVLERATQGGACRARNDAIAAAKGELITGLDDDDELKPEHIEKLVRTYSDGRVPFVATTSLLLRPEGPLVRHRFEGPIPLAQLLEENVVGNQVLTRTEYLRELNGFDPEMPAWQDYDLWVRLASRYGAGLKIDARTYLQHQDHELGRISTASRILAARARFVQKHRQLLGPKQVASLELLAIATAHQPMTLDVLARFFKAGLYKRATVAFLSNRYPWLRRSVLSLKRMLLRVGPLREPPRPV